MDQERRSAPPELLRNLGAQTVSQQNVDHREVEHRWLPKHNKRRDHGISETPRRDRVRLEADMLTRSLVMQLLRCDRDGRGGVHLVTVDGLDYDLQADGDFTLVRSTQPGEQFDIQIRTEPWAEHPLTSLTVKAAGQVSRHAVKFGLGGFSRVDAVLDSSLSADGSLQDLCGGTL